MACRSVHCVLRIHAIPLLAQSLVVLQAANEGRTVCLISGEDADTGSTLERWIGRDYRQLFESELEGWYTDPTLWPEDRSFNRFREWFDVECHTVLVDTVGGVICDDDA